MRRSQFALVRRLLGPDQMTLEVLAQRAGVHPQRVLDYVEYGLLEPDESMGGRLLFTTATVARLVKIERLRRDLGVNLTGIAIILDLLERLQKAALGARRSALGSDKG
jgi:DNA-binding transcriptional MerR regulator